MPLSSATAPLTTCTIARAEYAISRPHRFGMVIHRRIDGPSAPAARDDYLHDHLLAPDQRDEFFDLIATEGLVVCKNIATHHPTYRKVRGKSSAGKLSQAEYYHHDGCSCPTKPQIVEIRLPHQDVAREIATAIAPFADVIKAMLEALPEKLMAHLDLPTPVRQSIQTSGAKEWDKIQGRITRLIRRELDAESSRAWFRKVDQLAGAYVLPWEMGESRLMLNNHDDLTQTMQHRRSLQKPKSETDQNGSLVKRWTAEEYPGLQ